MQKEILTKEKCIIDVKANYHKKSGFIDYLIFLIFALSVLGTILLYIFTRSPLSFLIIILPVALITVDIYMWKLKIKKITPNRIVIREYRCNQITEDLIYKPRASSSIDAELRYIMYLENIDKYVVPRYNYEWSKLYNMSDKTVNITTLSGDIFYVVFLDDNLNQPLAVYNTKLFEYNEYGL